LPEGKFYSLGSAMLIFGIARAKKPSTETYP
jgi:hypothetical protein